jgi:hypothetical protein
MNGMPKNSKSTFIKGQWLQRGVKQGADWSKKVSSISGWEKQQHWWEIQPDYWPT